MSRSNMPSSSVPDAQVQKGLQEALQHLQAGKATHAEVIAKALLRAAPHLEAAHVLLARTQRMQGFNKHALQSCKTGLTLLPKSALLLIELAMIHRAGARAHEAESTYRHVLTFAPDNTMAMHNLANLLQSRGVLDEAEGLYRQVLTLQPQMAAAHFELGNVLATRGDTEAAHTEWRHAVQCQPSLAKAWFKIGEALMEFHHSEAIAAFRKGLQNEPDDARSLALISKLLSDTGRSAEGEQYAQMALRIEPGLPLAHYALGLACKIQGRMEAARHALSVAARTTTDPALRSEAIYLQALCHLDQGHFSLAMPLAEALMDMSQADQQRGMARHVMGSVLFDAGRVEEARMHFAAAVSLSPAFIPHRITLTASSLYVDEDNGQSHRELAERLLGTLRVQAVQPPSPSPRVQEAGSGKNRRIRIGWLSGDFRLHSCAFFLAPLLEQLDAEVFECFAYDTGSRVDAVMARFQQLLPHWRAVAHLQAAELARTMAADRLDVLVDLAGLSVGGRLDTLAAQPAPIQLSWLGYLGTSGHHAIQYRLTDQWAEGPDTQASSIEQAIVLQRPYVCYRAPADAPDVAPLPMREGCGPTFGSFNALSKLSEHTVSLWSAILKAIPDARLLLKTKVLADDAAKAHTLMRFAAHGIPAERLTLIGWASQINHHLSLYEQVDVALDPFPYNGVTTTCEALWMGVPVVSLVGQTVCSRQGHTLLHAVGLGDLACTSDDQVVERCVALVQDPQGLATLRGQLRARMANSPLCDAADMARAFSDAIRQLLPAD